MLVFVYGTLRSDASAAHHLKESFSWGPALTSEKMALFEGTIPAVTDRFGVSKIKGELHEISEKTMKRLDAYEGHPEYYCRELRQVTMPNGKSHDAWIYLNDSPRGVLNMNGEFGSKTPVSINWGTQASLTASRSDDLLNKLLMSHGGIDPKMSREDFFSYISKGLGVLAPGDPQMDPHWWVASMIDRKMLTIVAPEVPVMKSDLALN